MNTLEGVVAAVIGRKSKVEIHHCAVTRQSGHASVLSCFGDGSGLCPSDFCFDVFIYSHILTSLFFSLVSTLERERLP